MCVVAPTLDGERLFTVRCSVCLDKNSSNRVLVVIKGLRYNCACYLGMVMAIDNIGLRPSLYTSRKMRPLANFSNIRRYARR